MYSEIKLAPRSSRAKPDAIAVFIFDKAKQLPEGYQPLDAQLGGGLAEAIKRTEFSAGLGTITTLYPVQGPQRVFVCGLGDPVRFESNALRTAAAKLTAAADAAGVRRLQLEIMPGVGYRLAPEQVGAAVGDGFVIGHFNFKAFQGAAKKSQKQDETNKNSDLTLEVPSELRDGIEQALAVGHGVNTTRRLAATPPNVADPAYIVTEARQLAQRTGIKCSVIDEKKAHELGMGGLIAVGRGGSKPPALICLEWKGPAQRNRSGSKSKKKTTRTTATPSGSTTAPQGPIMLVGKAVTFDTGGYSLKPDGGKGMKYDKCGGMTVLGAMEAVAMLKLPIHVVGLVPVAENMIDEDAYRVDDILTMYNGVTVEVTNTDAEGRLILADALAYGTKRYKPRAVIDLATLTGGVVVALGSSSAGLFCNDDGLLDRMQRAATSPAKSSGVCPCGMNTASCSSPAMPTSSTPANAKRTPSRALPSCRTSSAAKAPKVCPPSLGPTSTSPAPPPSKKTPPFTPPAPPATACACSRKCSRHGKTSRAPRPAPVKS